MISSLFSIPKIQDGRHIVLIMFSDLLKNTKICDATPRNQAECAQREVPGIQRVG